MNDLDPRQLERLTRYGFDPELQQSWQRRLANGELSRANNTIEGELLPPPSGAIRELPAPDAPEWHELERIGETAIANGEFAVCILNGGMATRFGGVVKGVVQVRDDLSFLGLAVQDAVELGRRTGGRVRILMMNSFATDEATREHFAANDNFGAAAEDIEHFSQYVQLRMTPDGELFRRDDGQPSPYGPGHGDFAAAMRSSGVLQRFLDDGGRYVFVRNVDNLGARCSAVVLGHHIQSSKQITAEQTHKVDADVGGSPYLHDGRVQLVEQIRYPLDFDASVVDVFNCNTLTFSADALTQPIELGRYYVEKQVDGRAAVQIEHLIGELTAHLSTNFVSVPRSGPHSRFLPIKRPDELQTLAAEIDELYAH